MNKYYANLKIEVKNRFILYGENLEDLENEIREELETAIKNAINNNLDLKKNFYDAKPKVYVSVQNEDEYKGYKGKYDRTMYVEMVKKNEARS